MAGWNLVSNGYNGLKKIKNWFEKVGLGKGKEGARGRPPLWFCAGGEARRFVVV